MASTLSGRSLLRTLARPHTKCTPRSTLPRRTLVTAGTAPRRSPLLTGLYATAFLASGVLLTVYYLDSRSALHRYVVTPALRHAVDAETGHRVAVQVLRSGLAPRDPLPDDARLEFELWGHRVSNPVGVAAGFDKNGEAIDGLFDLGFSWVEIGSVTPKPQPGNPKPRVFHLTEDSAMINRYGFPSQGHASVLARLRARTPAFPPPDGAGAALRPGALLAVNLGKNKTSPPDAVDDFVAGVRAFGAHADVLVVNVSSPNTPGLRGLQNRDQLDALLEGVCKARDELATTVSPASGKPKLVLKIAPDLDEAQIVDIADVVKRHSIDGVIVSNTSIHRPSTLKSENKDEAGGLSGAPLKPHTLAALRTLRAALPASTPLIGCGGVASGADALEYARAGAALVQLYTAFGYAGAGACRRIKDELAGALAREGTTWAEVVAGAVKRLSAPEEPSVPAPARRDPVELLVEEAQELRGLLDSLGKAIAADGSAIPDEIVAPPAMV